MKCILCRTCGPAREAIEKKFAAWVSSQTNDMDVWLKEIDQEAVHRAADISKSDPKQGFEAFLRLATLGSVWSMIRVGWAYQTGTGVRVDLAKAREWYQRAHDAGSNAATLRLGRIYADAGDFAKAEEIFSASVAKDWPPAMHRLARVYLASPDRRQRRDKVHNLLERASSLGDVSAKSFLATLLTRGYFGIFKIPAGIRMSLRVADEMSKLVEKDEWIAATQLDHDKSKSDVKSTLTSAPVLPQAG